MSQVRCYAAAGLDAAARRSRRRRMTVGALDKTGQEKQGSSTSGVKRQYMSCAGRVANGINTVHLSYVREKTGHALAGARQWIPAEDIQAGMAGRSVQHLAVARVVFCAERVGAAQAGSMKCLVDDLAAETVTLAERCQAAERALTVRGCGCRERARQGPMSRAGGPQGGRQASGLPM